MPTGYKNVILARWKPKLYHGEPDAEVIRMSANRLVFATLAPIWYLSSILANS